MTNFSKYSSNKTFVEISLLWKKIITNRTYRIILGVITGAGVGLLYWNFIGCTGGTCPLTSNPYNTTIIFGFLGGVFAYDKKSKPELADTNNKQE